jgi:cell division protein FtsN
MKKLTCVLIMLTLLGSGCKFVEKYTKKGKKAKAAAMQKAKEDSLAKAKAIEFEKAAQAREQARQDSIRQVEEYESQHRFHVIIGSFKVPSNATSWEQEVRGMGFNTTRILQAPNGFNLVSVGAFNTYSKAFNEIDRINSNRVENPLEMWVYEKQ